MGLDARSLVRSVLSATTQPPAPPPRDDHRGPSAARSVLLGAGLVAVARLALRSRGRQAVAALHERLEEFVEDEDE